MWMTTTNKKKNRKILVKYLKLLIGWVLVGLLLPYGFHEGSKITISKGLSSIFKAEMRKLFSSNIGVFCTNFFCEKLGLFQRRNGVVRAMNACCRYLH